MRACVLTVLVLAASATAQPLDTNPRVYATAVVKTPLLPMSIERPLAMQ